MERYSDGLKVSEQTARCVRAFELARESYGLLMDVWRELYGERGNDELWRAEVQAQFDAYTDSIFKVAQCSIMEKRAFTDSREI